MVSKIAQFILFYRELINYKKKLAGLFLFLIYCSGIIKKMEPYFFCSVILATCFYEGFLCVCVLNEVKIWPKFFK